MLIRLKWLIIPMVFLATPLFAQVKKLTTDLTPFLGYRNDTIKWKIQDGASFQWKDLSSINYGVNGLTTFKDRYLLKYEVGLANILSGHMNDKGYLIPGFSSSSSLKGWGIAFRPNLGIGYKFKPTRCLNINPQIGFSYDLIYVNNNKNSGPFSSVKNTIQWYGPWLGLDAIYKLQHWRINVGGAYYLAFYKNRGNWKVAGIKSTMSESGTGQGISSRFGVSYEIVKSLTLGAMGDIQWRWLNSGHDTRKFDDLPGIKEKIKKVSWTSVTGNLTLTKTF